MTYNHIGIKERLDQLNGAKPHVAYRGLKALDNVITLEMAETSNQEEISILLTYRRQVRMQLRRFA